MPRASHPSPVGVALAWAARIMAAGVAMFLPAVVGGWLDARCGTSFLGPLGLVVGLVGGIAWLVQVGRRRGA